MKKEINKVDKQSIINKIKGFDLEYQKTIANSIEPICRHNGSFTYFLYKSPLTKLNVKMEKKCNFCAKTTKLSASCWKLHYYKFFENPIKWALHYIKCEEPIWPSIVDAKTLYI